MQSQEDQSVRLHSLPEPEALNVATPERVMFSFQVADIASRFYALLTDTIIQGVLLMGVMMITALLSIVMSGFQARLENLFYALIALEVFLVQFGYFVLLEWRMQGQTPGKAIFGLRVMKQDGTPFTLGDSMIRNLVRVFDRRGEVITYSVPKAEGAHGGSDARLVARLFQDRDGPDPLGHMASSRDGAQSILIGIAANQSIATGLPVEVPEEK